MGLQSVTLFYHVDRLTIHSYAKLNLYLQIVRKRKDNYHTLKTVFERINLFDTLILKNLPGSEIKIISESSLIPKNSSNLAWRSAKLLQDSLGLEKGVEIRIVKRIPVGSGMGGGSSNAASALIGLNCLWKLRLNRKKLLSYARRLGADVPFFIHDAPFAYAGGVGDRIKKLSCHQLRLWHILVVPYLNVSTSFVYGQWDALFQKARLTLPKYNVNIVTLALEKNNFALISQTLFNSLERVTEGLYPEIRQIKEKLLQCGVKSILMSGSGPAVFGIVSSRKEAVTVFRHLKEEKCPWRVFAVQTY